MKLNQRIIIILAILFSLSTNGQDTVSVYFKFGLSRLSDDQLEKLNTIPTNYYLSDLDSIHFIGMADSIGNFKANIKLSKKRAINIAKHCENIIPENVHSKIIALGEKAVHQIEQNRRVDMVLYFQPTQKEISESTSTKQVKDVCYTIDYELLHRSHIRTTIKRRKEFTIIEVPISYLNHKKEHYYGSTTNTGEFIAKRVKWSTKRTGNLWWFKTRHVTAILKDDFDTYKIFKIGDLPCDTCSENFQIESEISKEDTCIQVDRFIMKNAQYKTLFLNNKWLKIRIPREYVNSDDHYFIGCTFDHELKWETKKGRRRQRYYYAKLPISFNHVKNITRVMDCCEGNPEPSNCDLSMINCSTIGPVNQSFMLNLEIGNLYQQSINTPYIGIGISKQGLLSRTSILVGTDINLGFLSSIRYQHHFLSFPFNAINPFSTWQTPDKRQFVNTYGRLYLGTELKTRISKSTESYLEQNIHIGLRAVHNRRNAFIQYGLGLDYLENNSSNLYPIVQIGLNIKIKNLSNR